MTRLKVQIDKERDLPELQAMLTRMGLKFHIDEDTEDDDDWGDLPEAAIESIKAGIEDFKAGRVASHADAIAQIDEHLKKRKVSGQRFIVVNNGLERIQEPFGLFIR